MTEQTRLDVLGFQGIAQQRIFLQINLPNRQVIRSLPVSMYPIKQVGRKRASRWSGRRLRIVGCSFDGARNSSVECKHHALSPLSTEARCLAITRSSSVAMTRTTTRLLSADTTASCAALLL